jgi:RNA polymerase sigma-70 factor (ECF subfamily)
VAAVPSASRAVGVEPPAAGIDAEAALLYERHYTRVLRFCRSRLASPEDAEDAAQTTFTYALGGLRRGVVPRVEAAWLLRIARNVCLDRWDAARRRGRVELARDPHVLEELAPARAPAEDDLFGLGEALLRLTEQQRRAILLREWQGLSYREVGEELDLSQQAVESLLFRARRALARDLRGERELRAGSNLGSLVAAVKSFFTGAGAAVKLAVVAATLATTVAVAGPSLGHKLAPAHSSRPVAPVPALATTTAASPAPRAGTRGAAAPGRAARVQTPRSSAGPHAAAGPRAPGAPAPRGAEPASVPTAPALGAAAAAPVDAPSAAAPTATADASGAAPNSPAAPAPTPPPAPPTVSVPPAPLVPPVEPPSLPSPSLPAVPGVPPVDPPALPPTPTVSTPELPVNLP